MSGIVSFDVRSETTSTKDLFFFLQEILESNHCIALKNIITQPQ